MKVLWSVVFLILLVSPASSQMAMPEHEHAQDGSLVAQTLEHTTMGTAAQPASTPDAMLMTMRGKWMFMFHANAFLNVQQQSGPRGADKVFSTNWFMPMAQRDLGPGKLTLRFMGSFEPATVTHRYYPELFQQGETAFGKPIVDGQHPHDFVMELAGIYDLCVRENTVLSLYLAAVGDPAMGPVAYPHRVSAQEDPIAPLGHHLQDSTHIAKDVATVGLTHRAVRVEASGFHGREPDEYRWNIDAGKLDSWSTRLTVNPAANWSLQYSFAHLTSPEEVHPDEDVQRMTASIAYNRPFTRGNWASLLLWGRNRGITHDLVWNSYLAESTLRFADNNSVWTRIENVDRTSDLLDIPGPERVIGRVQAFTAGYDRDLDLVPHVATAVGAQVTWYNTPSALLATYGNHPAGVIVFLRVRPKATH